MNRRRSGRSKRWPLKCGGSTVGEEVLSAPLTCGFASFSLTCPYRVLSELPARYAIEIRNLRTRESRRPSAHDARKHAHPLRNGVPSSCSSMMPTRRCISLVFVPCALFGEVLMSQGCNRRPDLSVAEPVPRRFRFSSPFQLLMTRRRVPPNTSRPDCEYVVLRPTVIRKNLANAERKPSAIAYQPFACFVNPPSGGQRTPRRVSPVFRFTGR
jgi:hypothetical protein